MSIKKYVLQGFNWLLIMNSFVRWNYFNIQKFWKRGVPPNYYNWLHREALPFLNMRRHLRTTGPFKQENQKSWPESFTRQIPEDSWEMIHTFEEKNLLTRTKPFFFFFVILRFFWIVENWVIKFNHEQALNQKKTENTQV